MSIFLESEAANRFPVSLLTGFLGSGKTTLLNRLVQHPGMAKTAVVINEFGDVALDQYFVEKSDGEVTVLANGCLCCNVQDDFEGVVGTLFARRDRGELPAFDRMIIETTGLADPAPIMQMLLGQPLIVNNFRLDNVVATVDAVHGSWQLREHPEAVKQVVLADRLVVTKTDIAGGGETDALLGELEKLNPGTPVIRAQQGDIEPALLFSADPADPRDMDRWLRRAEAWAPSTDGSHDHAAHRHLEGVSTFTLRFDEPLEWRGFSRWLTALKIRYADQLLRVKGIVYIAGEDAPIAIQGVHHVFHPPLRLPRYSDAETGSCMVFITRGLAHDQVEAHWRAFTAANPSLFPKFDGVPIAANGRS